ncbi:MAG TPA: flavin monoamine oxidase family protein [Anaerolineales bacterium]|nr:flavin monoamine oxidase family protein [Anaerolineales bacterium]
MNTEHPIQDYVEVIQRGIRSRFRDGRPKKVVIVGAGMAGLVAGYELKRAGHTPIILEAQQRVGGRIYTLREPFTEGLYAEAGAMRIPRAHTLTMAYIEKFNLQINDFTMDNPNAYYYISGKKVRAAEANANPALLGFEVHERERGKTASQMYAEAIRPLMDLLEKEGDAAWEQIVAEYDQYSTREFLELKGWSEGMIEMFGLLHNQESVMNSSFLELFREDSGGYYMNMIEVQGGTDRLPHAFLPYLKENIRFGAKMIAIDQSPDDVTIHYQTAAGRFTETGEYAIITIPFPVLRHVEVLKPFTRAKQRAIRQLHYDASAKILFQCRRRFWEEDDGIFGGGTVTDLPIRNLYYPDHGRETGRGVILASYTWSEDAQRWGSLKADDRIVQALEDVAEIHPQVLKEFEVGASWMWHDDEFAGGAFALFDPGQQTLLHDEIVKPEGRIHFAGEHASLYHAWIQGAIESGLRAAIAIHQSP